MCNKIILSNYIKNRQCKCAYELFVIYTHKALRIKKKNQWPNMISLKVFTIVYY